MMTKLPKFFGYDPLLLLAEVGSPKMIYEWIDKLYEAEYELSDRRFFFQVFTVAVLSEHIKTYPLNTEYQKKFDAIVELVVTIGSEGCQADEQF